MLCAVGIFLQMYFITPDQTQYDASTPVHYIHNYPAIFPKNSSHGYTNLISFDKISPLENSRVHAIAHVNTE